MTDLTKITTAFGLLDKETQEALKAHCGPWEHYFEGRWDEDLGACKFALRGGADHWVVRAKPQPLTKPSIDWSHVAPQYKWLARDKNGEAFVFSDKPWKEFGKWVWEGGEHEATLVSGFLASYTPGTCDWRDSLVERPE